VEEVGKASGDVERWRACCAGGWDMSTSWLSCESMAGGGGKECSCGGGRRKGETTRLNLESRLEDSSRPVSPRSLETCSCYKVANGVHIYRPYASHHQKRRPSSRRFSTIPSFVDETSDDDEA
jgi:hypothetical protein